MFPCKEIEAIEEEGTMALDGKEEICIGVEDAAAEVGLLHL